MTYLLHSAQLKLCLVVFSFFSLSFSSLTVILSVRTAGMVSATAIYTVVYG